MKSFDYADIYIANTEKATKSGVGDYLTDHYTNLSTIKKESPVEISPQGLTIGNYTPFESIFSERYAMDPSKFIDPKVMEDLNNIIGLSAERLQRYFRLDNTDVLNENYRRGILPPPSNNTATESSSVVKNNIITRFSSVVIKVKGFFKKYVKPDSEKWETPLSKEKEGEIVATCSGFAAMVIVESLALTENDLREQVAAGLNEIKQSFAKQILEKKHCSAASAQRIAEKQIKEQHPDLYKFVKNKDHHIFNLPFAKDKDLAKMTPAKLLDVLNKSGALTKLPQMEIIEKYLVDPD
jgi:hypothetical protein